MLLIFIKPTVSNPKNTYFNVTDDVVVNKHNTVNTNDNINVTTINKPVNFDRNSSFTKKIKACKYHN